MLKTFVFCLLLIFCLAFFLDTPLVVFAQEATLQAPSATLAVESIRTLTDTRTEALSEYLLRRNAPFATHAGLIVSQADKYNLDWRLLVAISGVESTFGQRYPQGSFNAWGWGIYGDNRHGFSSWEDAITTISKELRVRYMDRWGAKDVYQIGNSYAASPTWAARVISFMNTISDFEKEYQSAQLPILL